jgi:hypothetical protein
MWITKILKDTHEEPGKAVCSELLEEYKNGGDDYLARILTGDGKWLHISRNKTGR